MGFATDMGGQAFLTLANFIAVPFILRFTSSSLYGFWVATLSILGFLALTDLGLGVSLTRLIAGSDPRKNASESSGVVSTAFYSFCLVGLVFLGLGLGMSPYIPGWFKIPAGETKEVITAYTIAIVSGAISLPATTFGSVVIGFQRMAAGNIIRNVFSVAGVGLSIGLLYFNVRLAALPLASLFTVLTVGFGNYVYVRKNYSQIQVRFSLANKSDLKRLFSFGGYFQLGRIANIVASSTDSMVIAATLGASHVTPYAVSSKLATTFNSNIASKLPIAVFPAISQMYAQGETDKVRGSFLRLSEYSTRLAAIGCAVLLLANREFVGLWVGPSYFGGVALNVVFAFWVLQSTLIHGIGVMVHATGDLRNWVFMSLAEAVLNLVLTLLLVKPLGLVGVALGTVIGKTLTTGWYVPYWICGKIGLPVRTFLSKGIFQPALRSMPSILLALSVSVFLAKDLGWYWLFLIGFAAVVGNFISFEGIHLHRLSNLPWRERIQKVLALNVE
jgi:O-antigen/teichoic acid export membrane protein